MNPFVKFWSGLTPRKQEGIRLVGIAVVFLLTAWVLISVVSYFFTWQADQSVQSSAEAIRNGAASSGLSLGRFLVTDSFGVAALCIVAMLLMWCVKLVWKGCPYSMKKVFFGLFTLSFLLSWILAFAGLLAGGNYTFGGGLGGRCGAAVVMWAVNLVGPIVTALLLVLLSGTWLYCMSRRFSSLLMGDQPEQPPDGGSTGTAAGGRNNGRSAFCLCP